VPSSCSASQFPPSDSPPASARQPLAPVLPTLAFRLSIWKPLGISPLKAEPNVVFVGFAEKIVKLVFMQSK